MMTTPAKHAIDPTAVAPITLERVITELRQLGTSDRLLGLYELGLEGCANHDPNQVTLVVMELISSLDYEYADIADGFRRVYEYCLQQARGRAARERGVHPPGPARHADARDHGLGDEQHKGRDRVETAEARARGTRSPALSRGRRKSADVAHRVSYSSWRRHQTPVSLRPLGARSSHWYMPQRPSSPRA